MTKSVYSIVGMGYRGAVKFVAGLPLGETLTLLREPNNDFDPNAIQVWARGTHIGFVKATQARGLAVRMDAQTRAAPDTSITGKLANIGKWPQVEIEE